MDCSLTCPEGKDVMDRISGKAMKNRIPLSGTIELTAACNLRCRHCYIAGPEPEPVNEMDTETIFRIIDRIVENGCLFLLITGGDPLFRKDFDRVYAYAKKKGLVVSVYTNGTLVSDRIVSLFREMPPHMIEISIYGASEETYESITGVKGSFEACINGIEKLLAAGLPVKLKSILMTLNEDEFDRIEAMAEDYGVPFRMDASIMPGLNGNMKPLELRVSPEKAVAVEFGSEKRREQWIKFSKKIVSPETDEYLYSCGSGLATFYITSAGMLQPCLMASEVQFDLKRGSFDEGWPKMAAGIIGRKKGPDNRCRGCDKAAYCGYCPPFFMLENGSFDDPSDYLCSIGRHRFEEIAHSE